MEEIHNKTFFEEHRDASTDDVTLQAIRNLRQELDEAFDIDKTEE